MSALIGVLVGLAAAVISLIGDRRTPEQKIETSRRQLGVAIGVPGLFDRRGER